MIIETLTSHLYEEIALLVLLAFSAFFSGSETALFSLTREEIRRLERAPGRSGRAILALLKSPQTLLSAILFGNMIVNITFYSLSCLITFDLAKISHSAGAASGIVSLFAVILFGEVTPKGIAVGRPLRIAHLVAPVLHPFVRLAAPVSAVLRWAAQRSTAFIAGRVPRTPNVTREELQLLVAMAEQHGVLDREKRGMIQQVVDLADIRVRQVMLPRVDMPLFNLADSREKLHELIRRTHEERIVVFEGSSDSVVGLLSSRSVFLNSEKPVRALLQPVRFAPDTQPVESLLRQFRRMSDPVAVVVDEFGGTAGLVTQELILEQVLGQIREEFEPVERPVERVDEDTYVLAGDLNTREWRQFLGVGFDSPGVETLAGVVTSLLGRIPHTGERVNHRGLCFTVERMSGRRVELVRVQRTCAPEDAA